MAGPNQSRNPLHFGRALASFLGCLVPTALAGGVVGCILTPHGRGLGFLLGSVAASPVAMLFGLACAFLELQPFAVILGQIVMANVFGLLPTELTANALLGQLVGGITGLMVDYLAHQPKYPPGHCQHCGYNLYGLPERRCPECGTPF